MPWEFARDLLGRGLINPNGDGDVHIWPNQDGEGHAVVIIELCSPQGHALIELPTEDVLDFIARSYTMVASGHESAHLDLDATIAANRASYTS